MKEKKDQTNWLAALKDAKEILEKFQCKYFLDSGTLLGAVREGKFIEWDNDIDLGVVDFSFNRQTLLDMSKMFYKKGYNVSTTLTGINVADVTGQIDLGIKFYECSDDSYFTHMGHLNGSAFFASMEVWSSNEAIHKAGYGPFVMKALFSNCVMAVRQSIPETLKKWFGKKANVTMVTVKVPKKLLANFEDISFYGEQFKVPASKEDYLILRYGSHWMKPKQDYIYYEEDGAISKD